MDNITKLDNLPKALRYLIVFLVVLFISFLCPNNVKFKYNFEKGMAWKYEDLIASFDFAIKKPGGDIDSDVEKLTAEFPPYYRLDQSIAKDSKAQFNANFDLQLEESKIGNQFDDVLNNSRKYRDFGNNYIDRIYNRGIIELNEIHQTKSKDFVINIVNGNTNLRYTLQRIPNVSKVNAWLTDSLYKSNLQEAEFLIPLLQNSFVSNVVYSDTLTNKFLNAELAAIPKTSGMVKKGQKIVSNNDIITDEIYQKLLSFKDQYSEEVSIKNSQLEVTAGYFILSALLMGVLLLFLQYNEPQIFTFFNRFIFILLWFVLYSYLIYMVESSGNLSSYLIPFCIVPIIIKNFYNERLALFIHIMIVLVASVLSSQGYQFTFTQIVAGIVAVLTTVETRYWSKFFISMGYILVTYVICYLGLSLIQEGSFTDIDYHQIPWFFLSVLLTFLAYPLIPLLERSFSFTSSITLAELSDMGNPLLKRLSIEAPGTLQHSLQVANLCEAAASKIGADALLVKVAALYHDIGKIKQPHYFIENQSGENPHNKINDLESAKIIIAHVTDGVEMAIKARIPNVLVDFIRTHHGTTRVEYFYRNHCDANPNIEVNEKLFRYDGPKPTSKEQSILLLADSLEAASKSLKTPTAEDINNLVDKIIAGKIAHGQLDNSELSFNEMETCKVEFKKLLKSIYHVRIEYPKDKKVEDEAVNS